MTRQRDLELALPPIEIPSNSSEVSSSNSRDAGRRSAMSVSLSVHRAESTSQSAAQQSLCCFAELAGGADEAALRSRAAFFALAKFAANGLAEDSDVAAQARMAALDLDIALIVLAPKEPLFFLR